MPRELARRALPAPRAEALPAAYWTRLEEVRTPGGTERIDLVLVGPSGVHVVIERPGPMSADGEVDDALRVDALRAVSAAETVAGLLPARYRHVVTPGVSLRDLSDVGVDVGVVMAASPDVLRHVWRHRPRVLSTSEAAATARLLRDRLEPCPADTKRRANRWWRRWWVVAAAALAGVAAGAAATAEASGVPFPWGLR